MNNLEKLGSELKLHRIRARLSLTEFAAKIGIESTYLSKIENGSKKPSEKILKKIREALVLSNPEFLELITLSGHEKNLDFTKDTDESSGKVGEINQVENKERSIIRNSVDVQVPAGTHVLYSDSAFITSGQFGIVFDFAQSLASTPQNTVVARIGMSIEHAKAFHKVLGKKIIEAEKFRRDIKVNKQDD